MEGKVKVTPCPLSQKITNYRIKEPALAVPVRLIPDKVDPGISFKVKS